MTVVLSLTSNRYILHVSDRLLTDSHNRKPLDPLANKTIILFARDAVAVVGYTGIAYVDHRPTDEWLAEQLIGGAIAQPPGRGASSRFGPVVDYHRDLGESVEALRAAAEANKSHFRGLGVRIQIGGIQWNSSGRGRPVGWCIGESKGAYVAVHDTRRLEPGHFHIAKVGSDDFTNDDLLALTKVVERTLSDPLATEQAMVDAVRTVSARQGLPAIGPDCMSVLIPWPPPPRVEVRYRPLVEGRAMLVKEGQEPIAIPAAFSPLVVTPNFVAYPSIVTGSGLEFGVGDFAVSVEAPDIPPGLGMTHGMSSQKRPRL